MLIALKEHFYLKIFDIYIIILKEIMTKVEYVDISKVYSKHDLPKGFREIPNYEDLYVVCLQSFEVYSIRSNQFLKPRESRKHYLTYNFVKNRKSSCVSRNRILFFAKSGWIPRKVYHLDQNKMNNHIDNLVHYDPKKCKGFFNEYLLD